MIKIHFIDGPYKDHYLEVPHVPSSLIMSIKQVLKSSVDSNGKESVWCVYTYTRTFVKDDDRHTYEVTDFTIEDQKYHNP